MMFRSILYQEGSDAFLPDRVEEPAFFADLNLDQVIAAVTAGRGDYDLRPFFHLPPPEMETVYYRQEVMKDLEDEGVRSVIGAFCGSMASIREQTAKIQKFYYVLQKQRLLLDIVQVYCDAVLALHVGLAQRKLYSEGLLAFRAYLAEYVSSVKFSALQQEAKRLCDQLATISYTLLVDGSSVIVRRYAGEVDYGAAVQETFEKFRQGQVKSSEFKLSDYPQMNHIEAGILEFISRLYPEVFIALRAYSSKYAAYMDETLGRFDREIQFYISYLDYIDAIRRSGLPFTYPKLVTDEAISSTASFDLALAKKLVADNAGVVTNDFFLKGPERIFVVSGPNQGGKTTFARAFGQLHHLARLGLSVPGSSARLFFYDKLFTHFEKEEDIHNHRGKLEDDLVRISDVLDRATPRSIIVLNEIFTSTTLRDALLLGRRVLERVMELDLLCVCVTFMDELGSLGKQTVSAVSTVVPENQALRTYKVIRRPADGRSYAMSIAEKYRVTYDCVKERLAS